MSGIGMPSIPSGSGVKRRTFTAVASVVFGLATVLVLSSAMALEAEEEREPPALSSMGSEETPSGDDSVRVSEESAPAIENLNGESWSTGKYIQLGLAVGVAIGILVVFLPIIFTRDGRRMLFKMFHVTRNTIVADVGLGGFIRLLIISSFTALLAALTRGFQNDGFHWDTFLWVFLAVAVVGALANLVTANAQLRAILSPGAGNQWRSQRKAGTAAVIEKISRMLNAQASPDANQVRELVSEILDLIVLHIRDHRASNREKMDVFANLLLDDGDRLVLRSRDVVHSGPSVRDGVYHHRSSAQRGPLNERTS